MGDKILQYISIITVAGAGISFVVGFIKYIDQRNREERTKRFELYHDLMRRVAGKGEGTEQGLPLTQQVAAIYELQHFKEYAYASVPILVHLRAELATKNPPPYVLSAVDETIRAVQA
ncbi:MAG: hypothetical protein JW955_05510 [Sedimentisphaerales bacterium]|nr:hypothetical protein [Sedimentisphaerales bacterium]